MSEKIPIIAIDGPSGSGKGTVSCALAKVLGWNYLDSGAIYRSLAVAAEQLALTAQDEKALLHLAGKMDLNFQFSSESSGFLPFLNGIDISSEIISEACGNRASQIATIPCVRAALLKKQRDFVTPPGLVADGRDMGSVVFPEADVKVFLTATVEERAKRRYNQLKEKGINVKLDEITLELTERDCRDKNRSTAPLIVTEDALVIDSSEISVEGVVSEIMAHFTSL